MSEYESVVAASMDRLADVGELLAGAIFALAAGCHTQNPYDQRQMTAILTEDAKTRYKDILRKVTKNQRMQMESFINDICKGKR